VQFNQVILFNLTQRGVPIEAEIKPALDMLISFQSKPLNYSPTNLWFKGGVIHRALRVDRESINNVSKYSMELQAGLGYRINEQTSLHVGYQLIEGKMPYLTINPELEVGFLTNGLPKQQAILIGISYHFGLT
jgi:hypothetical protein